MKERKLEVYLGERFVGTMAQTADRRVAFAYSEEWLDNGFAISPFSLPVEQKVFVPTSQAFSGLWGVFADSLPDAWGQLLVDRMLKARGILSADMTQLERLAIREWARWRTARRGISSRMRRLAIWTSFPLNVMRY